MEYVKAKKSLGQHFLKDKNIALKIVASLKAEGAGTVVEVGPGKGVLTSFLLERKDISFSAVEIDGRSVEYLLERFPEMKGRIIASDFLRLNLKENFQGNIAVIGNFPYNISSQIFFKLLENRHIIPELVGMVQKEVAERIAAKPGSKTYGILSVLLQAFYHIEYLFTVNEKVFDPPPKVKSAVIRLCRNKTEKLNCDESLFFRIVKTGFNQRRKILGNSLKPILGKARSEEAIFQKRPEQLSVEDFVQLTNSLEQILRENMSLSRDNQDIIPAQGK